MRTVTVGCKIPNGLVLEVGDKQVRVNGSNHSVIVGGHGVTENVDADHWDAWLAMNSHQSIVKAGHIFASEKKGETVAQAKANDTDKTGLEPLDPNKMPKGLEKVTED